MCAIATSPLVLHWLCDSPRTGCAWRITPLCMWREQAIIEWSRRVISIVACCHGAKLCAYAARDFRLQQYLASVTIGTTAERFKCCEYGLELVSITISSLVDMWKLSWHFLQVVPLLCVFMNTMCFTYFIQGIFFQIDALVHNVIQHLLCIIHTLHANKNVSLCCVSWLNLYVFFADSERKNCNHK